MVATDPGTYYVRDNCTATTQDVLACVLGTIGWSAITAWAPSAIIAAGVIRRQTAGAAVFTASRATNQLTVTAMTSGTIYLGMELVTSGGANREQVTALGTGTGGTGTYTVSASGTIASTTWNGNFAQGNQLAFVAVVAGTTGATEPQWSNGQGRGANIVDNTVTWIECTGLPALNGDLTNTLSWTSVRNTSPGRGAVIKDVAGTHIFIQSSVGGTCNNVAEPTWNVAAVGNTTTDGTVTWTYIGTSFGVWAAPLSTITQGTLWISNNGSGHTLLVGDDHLEQYNNSTSTFGGAALTTLPARIISIDHTSSSRPPVAADLKAGATVQTIGGNTVSVNGQFVYYDGFTFDSGVGSSSGLSPALTAWYLKNCTVKSSATGASGRFILDGSKMVFDNTSIYFGHTTMTVEFTSTSFIWKNSTILAAGSPVPTTFEFSVSSPAAVYFEGCDFSGISGTLFPAGTATSQDVVHTLVDCRLHASVTIQTTPADRTGPATDVVRCSSDTKTYIQRRYWHNATLSEEATVIRTSGATDLTTSLAWKIATNSNVVAYQFPFEAFPVAEWNPTTGSNVVVTMFGVVNAAALPNNDELWMEVEYLGNASYPLGSYVDSSKTNVLDSASALTADGSSAWDSLVTARANTHAYSVGDVIKVATNTGRIFFCTTAGTSAGSEPGGYASAVDGGSVTDNTAIFRAGMRFSTAVTLGVTKSCPQPQLAGDLKSTIKVAKASTTYYVDPLISLS